MDEIEIDNLADDLFTTFEESAYSLNPDDALALAEAMETRFSDYAEGIRYDLRRRR